jgi:hypothetical protein
MYLQSPSWPSYFRARSRHGCLCSLHLLSVPILEGKNLWMPKPRRSRGLKTQTRIQSWAEDSHAHETSSACIFQGSFGVVFAQFSPGIQVQPSGSSDRQQTSDFSFFLAALIATIFGVIHVAAWRFLFPSTAELMIWLVCSLLVTLVPLVVLLIPLFIIYYDWRRACFFRGLG